MTQLREFTEYGLDRFEKFLHDAKAGENCSPPYEIIEDASATVFFAQDIHLSPQHFQNRLEAGNYLVNLLGKTTKPLHSPRLWAWLTLYFFDTVCPEDSKSRRKVGQIARYIPDLGNYKRYYRHLLYGPFSICRAHRDSPERALATLCTKVDKPGDVVEALAARQEFISSPAIMEAATKLYVDPETGLHKRGAGGGGRGQQRAGNVRRLVDVTYQFMLTYDVYHIGCDDFINLLPDEFNRFLPGN